VAETQAKLSRSVEVTPFRIVATALLILLSPVSTRRAHVILVAAFGERFAPADNTLSRWVLKYGRLARKIMAESAAAALIRLALITVTVTLTTFAYTKVIPAKAGIQEIMQFQPQRDPRPPPSRGQASRG
jgi:hypothetical protein